MVDTTTPFRDDAVDAVVAVDDVVVFPESGSEFRLGLPDDFFLDSDEVDIDLVGGEVDR